jgi:hypothetical protein
MALGERAMSTALRQAASRQGWRSTERQNIPPTDSIAFVMHIASAMSVDRRQSSSHIRQLTARFGRPGDWARLKRGRAECQDQLRVGGDILHVLADEELAGAMEHQAALLLSGASAYGG